MIDEKQAPTELPLWEVTVQLNQSWTPKVFVMAPTREIAAREAVASVARWTNEQGTVVDVHERPR